MAGAASFEFPPLYHFPPLFTLQPVDATRAKQLEQWKQIVIGWHQARRQTTLVLKEWPHWENPAIKRKLSDDAIVAVVDFLVAAGSAEWIDAAKTRCKIFYQTPAEWAAVLYAWVNEHGMLGTVYTIYELSTGAVVAGAAFEGLDTYVLLKAAEVLASQGKADVFPGESPDEHGVTFKAPSA